MIETILWGAKVGIGLMAGIILVKLVCVYLYSVYLFGWLHTSTNERVLPHHPSGHCNPCVCDSLFR
jgi:hypothetical protein